MVFDDISKVVTDELVSVADKKLYDTSRLPTRTADKALLTRAYIQDAVMRSSLCRYKDSVYMFDGCVYREISMSFVEKGFNDFLYRPPYAVSADEFCRHSKAYMWAFKETLNVKVLHPSFDIRAFRNGVVDMRTFKVMPFDKKYECIYQHPYDFDMKAECPLWKNFLKQTLPDRVARQVLQMFFGLGLLGRRDDTPKVEVWLNMYGRGGNGKSTIIQVLTGIYGSINVTNTSLKQFLKSDEQGLRARFKADGSCYITCAESGGLKLDDDSSNMLKQIISGEPVSTRGLKHNEATLYNIGYLVSSGNKPLSTRDTSDGLFRRIIQLCFKRAVSEQEKDPKLYNKLMKEAPGIMAWAVRGLKNLKANGYKFPECADSKESKIRIKADSNALAAYIDVMGIRATPEDELEDEPIYAASNEIYNHFMLFCENNDLVCMSIQMFGRKLVSEFDMEKRFFNGANRYVLYGNPDFRKEPPKLKKMRFETTPAIEVDEEVY